jgi:agmatine/peptidylarginine deiminase
MIHTDYSHVKNLILAYPDGYSNEYEPLTSFYDSLIDLIPDDITLWLITNNKTTCNKLNVKYNFKKVNVITIYGWDEIWLRDCLGINAEDGILKPDYHPKYCALCNYSDYYKHINKLSKIVIKECTNKRIFEIPLALDCGNFSNNNRVVFITNKVLEDNREWSRFEICQILHDVTGLKVQILKRSKTDTIGHTDGFLQFISDDKVMLANYPSFPFLKADIDFIYEARKRIEKENIGIIDFYDRPVDEIVSCECYIHSKKVCYYSARGNYLNFLRLNNTIILPDYALPTLKESKYYSALNKEILLNLGFEVRTINCDQLSKQGGSLHCISYTF